MKSEHEHGIQSSVNIGGHPIHPMLVTLPVAAFIGLLLTDIMWLRTGDAFWARASWWLLVAGLATGLLAGLTGAVDYLTIEKVRKLTSGKLHAMGNIIALALAAANVATRSNDVQNIAGNGLILSVSTAALLGVTAWLGGELSFRHRIGVAAPSPSDKPD